MKTIESIAKWFFYLGPVLFLAWVCLFHPLAIPDLKGIQNIIHPYPKEGMLGRLNLTKSQYEFIRRGRAAARRKIAGINVQLGVQQQELKKEYGKPSPDMDRLDFLCGKIWQLKGEKAEENIIFQLELDKKILTQRQLGILEAIQLKEASANRSMPSGNIVLSSN